MSVASIGYRRIWIIVISIISNVLAKVVVVVAVNRYPLAIVLESGLGHCVVEIESVAAVTSSTAHLRTLHN